MMGGCCREGAVTRQHRHTAASDAADRREIALFLHAKLLKNSHFSVFAHVFNSPCPKALKVWGLAKVWFLCSNRFGSMHERYGIREPFWELNGLGERAKAKGGWHAIFLRRSARSNATNDVSFRGVPRARAVTSWGKAPSSPTYASSPSVCIVVLCVVVGLVLSCPALFYY